jgi:4-hydroxyphenylpyruvate dioxygenase-like putative hemolysin
MATTRWIIPEAKEPSVQGGRDARAGGASTHDRPLRLGLLDNTKDNAHLLLQLIGERVRSELGAEIIHRRKGNATVGAQDDMLDELAREADCVLTAMAD